MILSDLLGTDVYGDGGTRRGRVADARFVVDGAPRQLMAEARLLGLVVSPHSASLFWDTSGPNSSSRGRCPLC
jgi:sporulation protein YlmC with PRC-barrel domain